MEWPISHLVQFDLFFFFSLRLPTKIRAAVVVGLPYFFSLLLRNHTCFLDLFYVSFFFALVFLFIFFIRQHWSCFLSYRTFFPLPLAPYEGRYTAGQQQQQQQEAVQSLLCCRYDSFLELR